MNKTILSLLTAACVVFSGCLTAVRPDASAPEFVHATYSVAGFLTERELENPRYDRFHFIYTMASPAWWTVDFDQPRDSVLRAADSFGYEHLTGGIALTPRMIEKARSEGAKVLLCFGGTEQFRPLLERPRRFARLAEYMVRVVERQGFDGIDIDWELTVDPERHADLMCSLRDRLNELSQRTGREYYLTTALGADVQYDPASAVRLSDAVDWINVMTYDMGDGIWGDTPGHNTSMADLRYYLSKWDIFERSKICVGLASYGFHYRDAQPGVRAERPLSECGAYITYNEFLAASAEGWTEEPDSLAGVSYYFSPDRREFVTIENPASIGDKIRWIVHNGYRGVFWWEFHYDYREPDENDPDGSHCLMDVVTDYLNIP